MKKFLILAVLALLGLTVVDVSSAQSAAGGWRRRAGVRYAPAPSATVAQGQTGTGYRTYSYQPAPAYRSYSSNRSMGGTYRQYSGFGDATRKATGNY